ncbi:unnamed protein product [Rotaria magnacalcarata]
MNQFNVHLLNLPNEILLIILKQLNNIDVLYSLLGINSEKVNILAQENVFINTLNFVSILTDDNYSISNSILDRFCLEILPRVHHNVKSLILESSYMERILFVADYPHLTKLKLFDFNQEIASAYFKRK